MILSVGVGCLCKLRGAPGAQDTCCQCCQGCRWGRARFQSDQCQWTGGGTAAVSTHPRLAPLVIGPASPDGAGGCVVRRRGGLQLRTGRPPTRVALAKAGPRRFPHTRLLRAHGSLSDGVPRSPQAGSSPGSTWVVGWSQLENFSVATQPGFTRSCAFSISYRKRGPAPAFASIENTGIPAVKPRDGCDPGSCSGSTASYVRLYERHNLIRQSTLHCHVLQSHRSFLRGSLASCHRIGAQQISRTWQPNGQRLTRTASWPNLKRRTPALCHYARQTAAR